MVEPGGPLPEAEAYVWDYHPGMQIAREAAVERPSAHLLVVERGELAKSRENLSGAMLALKPVTKTVLAAWLEQAAGRRGPESAARLRKDRDELLQALVETNLRLQEYDQDRTSFLARVVHDFRTPLTATSGYCGLLLDGQLGPLTNAQRDVLVRVQTSLKKLSRMTSAMFQLSVNPRIQRVPALEQGTYGIPSSRRCTRSGRSPWKDASR